MPTFAFTYVLIAINVLMSVIAWNNANYMQKWIFHPVSIARNGDYWCFLSFGFRVVCTPWATFSTQRATGGYL